MESLGGFEWQFLSALNGLHRATHFVLTLVDDFNWISHSYLFNGSFLRYFEINCEFEPIFLVDCEYGGKASFVDGEGRLFKVSQTNRPWVELADERCCRFGVEDGDSCHNPVALVSFSQHHRFKVEVVVLQGHTQSKCFLLHVKNLSVPGSIPGFIHLPFQCKSLTFSRR